MYVVTIAEAERIGICRRTCACRATSEGSAFPSAGAMRRLLRTTMQAIEYRLSRNGLIRRRCFTWLGTGVVAATAECIYTCARRCCATWVPGCLTNRWSGRVIDKVPSSYIGVRAAQLNR